MHPVYQIAHKIRRTRRSFADLLSGSKRVFPQEIKPGKHFKVSRELHFTFGELISNYDIPADSLLLIGANDGSELADPAFAAFNSVTAIEPNRELAAELSRNLAGFKESKLFAVAVGSTRGVNQLNIADNAGQSSSLLEPKIHIKEAPHVGFSSTVEVAVERLDGLIAESECPEAWVIDVQGYELKALEGAGNLLFQVNYLFAEVNRAEVYADCAQVPELDSFLLRFGLRRVLTRWWGTWGDALYLRDSLTAKNLSADTRKKEKAPQNRRLN